MMNRGQLAFAHARIRAWKGRLLRRADILPWLTSTAAPLPDEEPFTSLMQLYQLAIALYPDDAPLLRSLLRLHETENLKLAWRVILGHIDRTRWASSWLLLGDLASIDPSMVGATLRDFVEKLEKTPYAAIAERVMLAYEDDLGAAELAFDHWASSEVMRQSAKLPATAQRLIATVIRERDAQLLQRGAAAYGLSTPVLTSAAVVARAPEDVFAIRQERLRLCRRTFVDSPFAIAPALAVLLLYEEQLRGFTALTERRGDESLESVAAQQLASSLMGAT